METVPISGIVELQKLDCNCNDCAFMVRNMIAYKKSEEFHRNIQQNDFDVRKTKLNRTVDTAYREQEFQKGFALEKELNNIKFSFDKSYVSLNYGNCSKLNKPVSFIPNTLQLNTQECFKHRKDNG